MSNLISGSSLRVILGSFYLLISYEYKKWSNEISFAICSKRDSKSHHFLAKKRESSRQVRGHSILTCITQCYE